MNRYLMALVMVFAASLGCPPAVAAAPFTVTYTFAGAPGDQASEPADSQAPGVFFHDITRGPGLIPATGPNTMNSSGWTTSAAPDLANDFYEFTVTPVASFEVSLTDLRFGVAASAGGPTAYEVRTSADGFTVPLVSFDSAAPGVTYLNDVNLRAFPGFQNLAAGVTFRLFAYHASSTASTFALIDLGPNGPGVQVSGTVVPEPSTLTLIGFGFASFVTRWRGSRLQPGRSR
jgi:hypothetical protein